MNILFNTNSLHPPKSGIGYYTQHLIEGMLAEASISGVAGWGGALGYDAENLRKMFVEAPGNEGSARGESGPSQPSRSRAGALRQIKSWAKHASSLPLMGAIAMPMREAFHRRRSQTVLDGFAAKGFLYHETNFVAAPYLGTSVVTVHDLSHDRHPEFHDPDTVSILRRGMPETFRRVAHVIADSYFTKCEIMELYGIAEERITTIHLGVDSIFRPYPPDSCARILKKFGLSYQQFTLSVCTLQPRKNLIRLVKAFGQLPEAMRRAYPLVLIGASGWKNSALFSQIQPMIASGEVLVPGYVTRNELVKLYAAAAVFAYPSLYEGFGLPVAEAMASGVPVLTSNTTSLPEVSGGAAIEVDPYSTDEIRDGLARLIDDASLRARLSEAGLLRAAELTWDQTVEATIQVYRHVA